MLMTMDDDGLRLVAVALLVLFVAGFMWSRHQVSSKKGLKSDEVLVQVGEKEFRLPIQRWVRKRPVNGKRKVILLVYGTRGDVQPMIALALELLRSGFGVTICAPSCYKEFIERYGVEYSYAGVDKVEQPQSIFEKKSASFADVIQVLNEVYSPLAEGMWKACQAGDYDLIVAAALTRSISLHIAEKLGLGCVCAHFVCSDVLTGEFPPIEYMKSLSGVKQTLPFLEGIINKALYVWRGIQIVRAAVSTGLADNDVKFRTQVVGLAKADPLVGLSDVATQPALHAYSPLIQPLPNDWPANVMMTGYWRLSVENSAAKEKLDALNQFIGLDAKPIVFITFGSMDKVDELLAMAVQAALDVNARAIIGDTRQWRAAKLVANEKEVFLCDFNLSHDESFPKCDLIIHHGGAGTTAAALYAGVPHLIIPILPWSDQPYWATKIEESKCGVQMARAACTCESISLAIAHCISEGVKSNSKRIADSLKSETPGTCIASQVIDQYCSKINAA